MEELKNNYRTVYCPDGADAFYQTEKAVDAIDVTCDTMIEHPHPEILKAHIPSIDLILREDDERWTRISNIIEVGDRNH